MRDRTSCASFLAGLAQTLREWKPLCPKVAKGEVDAAGKPVMALDLIFPNGNGNDESHANIVNLGLVPAMIMAGIAISAGKKDAAGNSLMAAKYSGMHALRHWFAGGMGLTLKEVQERMGHASITMTADRYGHFFPRGDIASEVDVAERTEAPFHVAFYVARTFGKR